MPRLPRRLHGAGVVYYHVMNRGHNREVVFQTDDDHAYFLELLQRSRQRCAVRLYHYCVLDNHFHLLVGCAVAGELARWMAGLLRAYVHHLHRHTGFLGRLWQGRFRSPAVAVEEYFLSCARCIERNPLAAGLVAQAWQYR
jgi:putative transposase